MKKFLDKIFKPYIFPVIILIIGAYLKIADNLNAVTEYFLESSSNFIKFFSYQFYLWEVILYLIIIFLFSKIYKLVFKSKSKKEKLMLKAIKKYPLNYIATITGTSDKFSFKYSLSVENEVYKITDFRPYCPNCNDKPIRMSTYGYSDFKCNCGKMVDYRLCKDIKSHIVTDLEDLE
nr:hypothetical protein [uncultured Psychroserpens sp.]